MVKELSFRKGLAEIVRLIEKVERRPTLVSIYGAGSSGKSYLIDKVGEYFEGKGVRVARLSGGAGPEFFEFIKEHENDVDPDARIQLYLFHVCHSRLKGWPEEDEPDYLAEKTLGRDVDLHVGIYNPKFLGGISGEYDVVIRNPRSVIKDIFSKKQKFKYE